MRCARARRSILRAHAAGESDAAGREVRGHLESCPDCACFAAEVERTEEVLGAFSTRFREVADSWLDTLPSPDAVLVKNSEQEVAAAGHFRLRASRRVAAALAATAATAATLLILFGFPPGREGRTPPEARGLVRIPLVIEYRDPGGPVQPLATATMTLEPARELKVEDLREEERESLMSIIRWLRRAEVRGVEERPRPIPVDLRPYRQEDESHGRGML